MASTRHPAVLAAAAAGQLVAYGIAWACILIFIIFQFIIVLPEWTWKYVDPKATWEHFRTIAVIPYGIKEDTYLFSGWDGMMLVFTWLPPAVACLIVLAPSLLLSKSIRKAVWEWSPMQALASVGHRVMCAASWPMWPHKFWLWWMNGLSVWDAFIWAGYFIFHIIGIYELTQWYMKKWEAWDTAGLYYHVPKSVYRLEAISLACSWVLYLDFTLLFFPVAHVSFLHKLMGSRWQAMVRYHRWLGHFGMWTLTGHALFYYWYWLTSPHKNFWDEFFDWNTKSSINFLAGSIAWLCGVALWITSINWVRRNYFKVFYTVHILGFIGFIMFAMIHYYWQWLYIAPGLIFWGLDIVFRVFQGEHVSVVSSVYITPGGNLARIDVPIDSALAQTVKAGQDVFLLFPTVSRWSWHPFTVFKLNHSDTPDATPSLTIAIKSYGRWTKKLLQQLQMGSSLPVRLVGPVGGLHDFVKHASGVVMFVGGVGASPALAALHHMIDTDQRRPTTVIFAARDKHEFTMLDEQLLQEASQPNSWLKLKLYFTGMCKCGQSHALERTGSDTSSSADTSGSKDLSPKLKADPGWTLPDNKAIVAAPSSNTRHLSSFGWDSLRRAQPRLLNNWHMFFALCFALTGGFMGAVQAQSAYTTKWGTVWTEHDAWILGFIYTGCIAVQAVGLPTALVIFPVHAYRVWKLKKQAHATSVRTPSTVFAHVLGSSIGVPESSLNAHIILGRPDIPAALQEAVQRAAGQELAVVLAGPTGMMNAAEYAAWRHNWNRSSDQPFMHVLREAYEL